MWRTTTVALVAVLLALSAGAALAATITHCTGGLCKGTKGDDLMDGTADVDKMHGKGGRDRLAGTANDDKVYGEAGGDMLGGRYDDPHTVSYIQLAATSDDPGHDEFYGGPDEDMIFARDCEVSQSAQSQEDCTQAGTTPTRDIIDCGPGSTDFASVDKKPGVAVDEVRNCERLKWTTENKDGCAFKPNTV